MDASSLRSDVISSTKILTKDSLLSNKDSLLFENKNSLIFAEATIGMGLRAWNPPGVPAWHGTATFDGREHQVISPNVFIN